MTACWAGDRDIPCRSLRPVLRLRSSESHGLKQTSQPHIQYRGACHFPCAWPCGYQIGTGHGSCLYGRQLSGRPSGIKKRGMDNTAATVYRRQCPHGQDSLGYGELRIDAGPPDCQGSRAVRPPSCPNGAGLSTILAHLTSPLQRPDLNPGPT